VVVGQRMLVEMFERQIGKGSAGAFAKFFTVRRQTGLAIARLAVVGRA